MSQLNALTNKSDTGYLSRALEMQDLSSNFSAFQEAFNYSDNFKTVDTSFSASPETTSSEDLVPEVADEAAPIAEEAAGSLELAPLAAIGGLKTTGDIASSSISNMLSSQFLNVNIANQQAHGLDAERQSSMVNQADQQSLANANHGMSIGSWLGPLGSYFGYAFSNTNVASNLNMNTGFGSSGMLNPELQDSVATTYASSESDVNQSVITQ